MKRVRLRMKILRERNEDIDKDTIEKSEIFKLKRKNIEKESRTMKDGFSRQCWDDVIRDFPAKRKWQTSRTNS